MTDAAKKQQPKAKKQNHFEKTGKSSVTMKWLERVVAAKKATGKLSAAELKTYRENLIKRHGLDKQTTKA